MSYYYKYNFVSPEIIYTKVKEELRSYFDAGVVDDVMFSRYTYDCIRKMGNSSYPVGYDKIDINGYMGKLPEDFHKMREVFTCRVLKTVEEVLPGATYTQTYIHPVCYDKCEGCVPDCIQVVAKTTGSVLHEYTISDQLFPGNIHTIDQCGPGCANKGSANVNTFDITGNKIIVLFPIGTVYITYYKNSYDDESYQMVPDFYEFERYLETYLKYKCFETIYNNITDESSKQIADKMLYYENKYNEAFIIAKTEFMKKTTFEEIRGIKSSHDRFSRKFDIR